MASQFDDSDFIDQEYQSSQSPYTAAPGNRGKPGSNPLSRHELDSRVGQAHQKLAELKRAQEELERERTSLEEARRRRLELQNGRGEMLENLTRGVTLMEQAEFAAKRDSEQMGKTLAGLREALGGVQAIHEESWTQENWNTQLTKSLASIENARMEWNQARLKWPMLDGQGGAPAEKDARPSLAWWQGSSFWELCRLGAALTWPVALVGLIGVILMLVFRLR